MSEQCKYYCRVCGAEVIAGPYIAPEACGACQLAANAKRPESTSEITPEMIYRVAELHRTIKEQAAEIERLREENQLLKLERDELVRHEERMHADIGAILGSDMSLVDAAARAVTEIERLRDQHDTYVEMVEQLTRLLDAAALLLRRPGRVEWGYDAEENALAYFLDGKFAGPTIRHAIRMAAKRQEVEDE